MIAYTIGAGLVPIEIASKVVARLAPQMGMSVEQFFEMNKGAVLSVEEWLSDLECLKENLGGDGTTMSQQNL